MHLEAGKRNLRGLPKSELPNAWTELKKNWFLIAPLGVLVYLLFTGYTPLFAGAVGLSLTVALILGTAIAAGLAAPGSAHRVLGRACPGLRLFARLDRDPRRSRRGGPVALERLLRPRAH